MGYIIFVSTVFIPDVNKEIPVNFSHGEFTFIPFGFTEGDANIQP